MLLKDKVAVIYGAGGNIGGAVARAFSADGARLFLVGRTRAKLAKTAADITSAGGSADIAELDASDEAAVERHLDDVVARAGRVDISMNACSTPGVVQGTVLRDLSIDDFVNPIAGQARAWLFARIWRMWLRSWNTHSCRRSRTVTRPTRSWIA